MTVLKEQVHIDSEISLLEDERNRFRKINEKSNSNTFEIAFSGHFSSGKSTIINTLLGANILPTSPIPTSANIINITNGELGLSIIKRGVENSWNQEIPWNKVREWGMDGQEISNISIKAPLPFLGENSSILDTPGVDSTDESHEAVTVEQLYTTDVIVYVMDYNHVQSETNLYFLKQLSLEKKTIYIVINQIDKHNEEEIPFSKFKQSILDVFNQWDIHIHKIYFTTMKEKTHPHNQYVQFEREIKSLLFNNEQLLQSSQLRLEQGFYQIVQQRITEEEREKKDEVVANMESEGLDFSLLKEQEELKKELESLKNYKTNIRKEYTEELGGLFKNVTLFPYTTTELTRNWIESIQPGFKVGFLFSKKKTEEEQERRLQLVVNELQNKIKTQLLFHLQTYFQKIDRSHLTNVSEFEEAINKLTFTVSASWLKERVKSNITNRDYVYTFTKEITSIIVKEIENKGKVVLDQQIAGLEENVKQNIIRIEERLQKLKAVEDYSTELNDIEKRYKRQKEKIEDIINKFPPDTYYRELLEQAGQKSYPDVEKKKSMNIQLPTESVIDAEKIIEDKEEPVTFDEEGTGHWLQSINEILLSNRQQAMLYDDRNSIIERIKRYSEREFVISLFGAFSAGKSSFANALIGENILPVSPNPTTATVNIIQRGNEKNPHGTARISLKSNEMLNDEVKSLSEQLGINLDLYNLTSWKPLKEKNLSSWQRTCSQYLVTLKESLTSTEWNLGNEFIVDLVDVNEIITNEKKASLVSEVNIYYNCPVTESGIILVDTPGVNSIHGRHTNVAFQQLRKSDAIFYLTYYNHSFSKADQYFLQQIGKVNESFQNDKLYFIINASDLAGSIGELNGVKKHVRDQLISNGIMKPRLYDLSSRDGLVAKKEGTIQETSFGKFEHSFYKDTILQLKMLSVNLITDELRHYVNKIGDSITLMSRSEEEQQENYLQLKRTVEEQISKVNESSLQYLDRDVQNDLEQLSTYLKERMTYVLNDYFTTAINVAVMTSDNKKELFKQFENGVNEWKHFGDQFLKQEIEGNLIRIEQILVTRLEKWMGEKLHLIRKFLPYVSCETKVEMTADSFKIQYPKLQIETEIYRNEVKSKKDFFEQGKVKVVKEKLVFNGSKDAARVISLCTELILKQLDEKLRTMETELKNRLIQAIHEEVNRFKSLTDPDQKATLEQEFKKLAKKV
ncbi:dynamin family protein [Evansella sp. AB-P1]|uniref:dynamin family protein n=1 Tax=Evansella sp. AB-P1 TaxID=3037653 RepID=UPI00241C4889|nr:dynamin family protein [Evansella sp. AB-P1]MDG5789550.1 dynamin family protein [Evansella sp. AB-P1]